MKSPLRPKDKRTLALIAGIALALTLVSVIVIVLSTSSRNRRDLEVEIGRLEREERALASNTSYGLEDFLLDPVPPGAGTTYPLREPRPYWTEEEVRRYWIDPALAGIGTLSERNDRDIMDSLGAE